MITVSIYTEGDINITEKLRQFATPEGQGDLLRFLAVNMLPVVHDRIHVEGKDASGGQIGTYSPGYMKVRTGNYPETVLKSGKNKGNFRTKKTKEGQAGVFTKGDHKGEPRPRYNRDSSTKVILSLTKEMELDFSVIADNNKYGLGFKNEHNFNKSQWVESTYKKKIFSLTPDEQELTLELAKKYITNALQ